MERDTYGWLRITKHSEKKALVKGELHHVSKGKHELILRVLLMYDIPDPAKFSETYLLGGFYSKGDSFFTMLKNKVKDADFSSIGGLLGLAFGAHP